MIFNMGIVKLNPNQEKLLNYLQNGGIVKQENNKLWWNGEVLNTKTLVSLMFKLYGRNYVDQLNKVVVVV
jgi:hypothetical protein